MLQQFRPALVSVVVFTILAGFLFPLAITAVARVFFPYQAGGSLIRANGHTIGSPLIGQSFASPAYFHPRPSAAGNGYDAANSGGTNLGPTSSKLNRGIKDNSQTKDTDESYAGIPQLAAAYRQENGLASDAPIPVDAVTRSASGLDPHISPENARLQSNRVAAQRKLDLSQVQQLVRQNTESRQFGVLGEPRVNVLQLNLALDHIAPAAKDAM